MPEKPYVPQDNRLTDETQSYKTTVQQRTKMRQYYRKNHIDIKKDMRKIHNHSTSRSEGGVTHERRFKYLPDGRSRRHSSEVRMADLEKVVDRITKEVHNKDLARKLIDKVTEYTKTHDKRFDLTNEESARIYHNVDFGNKLKLPDRELDVEWKNHAEFRSELRDVKPKDVNEQVKKDMMKRLEEHKTHGDERLKTKNNETVVVDYSLETDPAKAEVITVWASELIKIARLLYGTEETNPS